MRLSDGDSETVLTVKVALDTGSLNSADPDTAARLGDLKRRARQGVDDLYNRGHRLPSGDRLRVELEFLPGDAVFRHRSITVVEGDNLVTMGGETAWWRSDASARELGHVLGDSLLGAAPVPADLRSERLLTPTDLHGIGLLADGALRLLGNRLPDPAPGFAPGVVSTMIGGLMEAPGHLYSGFNEQFARMYPNGTYVVSLPAPPHLAPATGTGQPPAPAAAAPVERTMFPGHWTSDDVTYAVEQAYLHARRTGDVMETDQGQTWRGVYGGIRIQGEVNNGLFTSFRPADDQAGLEAASFLPPNRTPDLLQMQPVPPTGQGEAPDLAGHTASSQYRLGPAGGLGPDGPQAQQSAPAPLHPSNGEPAPDFSVDDYHLTPLATGARTPDFSLGDYDQVPLPGGRRLSDASVEEILRNPLATGSFFGGSGDRSGVVARDTTLTAPHTSPLLRSLLAADSAVLRRALEPSEDAPDPVADPAAAEAVLRRRVLERLDSDPELAREAYDRYRAWAERTGRPVGQWSEVHAEILGEVRDWGELRAGPVRDVLAVVTARALGLRVTVMDGQEPGRRLAVFGPEDGLPLALDHHERDGFAPVRRPVVPTSEDVMFTREDVTVHEDTTIRHDEEDVVPHREQEVLSRDENEVTHRVAEETTVEREVVEETTVHDTVVEETTVLDTTVQHTVLQDTTVEPPAVQPVTVTVVQTDPVPHPPASVGTYGLLSASHMVTSIGGPDTRLVQDLTARITEVLPADTANRGTLARTLAESVLSGSGLRAQVSALSRGEVLHIPVGTDAGHGTITLHGRVTDLTHRRNETAFEYESGADRQVTLSTESGRRWRFGGGFQGRADISKFFRLVGSAGGQRDSVSGDGLTTGARFFSRAKTTEVTAVFGGTLHLEVGYRPTGTRGTEDLRQNPNPAGPPNRPNVRSLTTPVEVAMPRRETVDEHGSPIEAVAVSHFSLEPARLTEPRLHSSHVVLDVHANGEPRLRPQADDAQGVPLADLGPGDPTRRQVMAGVVDALGADARRALGATTVRALSDRLVAEFDYQRLHQDLKGMTNGESVVVRLPDTDVTVEVKAVNRRMQVQATTRETEFNTGAGSVLTRVRQKVVSRLIQAEGGLRGQEEKGKGHGGLFGGMRRGSDVVRISGRTLETGLTTKTKEPGAILDGFGQLEVVVRKGARELGTVEVPIGYRTVVPQSELAPRVVTVEQFRPELANGLPESTVVRDIGSLAELRRDLDQQGRLAYGSLWTDVREEVMQLLTQPAVASRLTAMTRGERFELTSFDQGIPAATADRLRRHGIKVFLGATIERTDHLRASDSADLSRQNESSTFTAERRLTGKHTVRQVRVGFPAGPAAVDLAAGDQKRVRTGVREGAADKLYANSKIRTPQDIYRARTQLTLTLEGGSTTRWVRGTIDTDVSVTRPAGAVTAPTAPNPPWAGRRDTELGASAVVAFPDQLQAARVVDRVTAELTDRFGTLSPQVARMLKEELGPAVLQANLSQLSRGGKLTVEVGGPTWSAEVVLRAGLMAAPERQREVANAEFEVGTQNRTGHGVSQDERIRRAGGAGASGKVGEVGVSGDYLYRRDRSTGFALDSSGSTTNRGKNVVTGDVSTATAEFRIEVRTRRAAGLLRATTSLDPVEVRAEIVAPRYGGPGDAPRWVPDRIWQTHLLGSSDVVTDVYVPARPTVGGQPLDFGAALLAGDGNAPERFGDRSVGAWLNERPDLKGKLLDVLTPNNLHDQLKAMMTGRRLVVSDGDATIRIGASVKRLTHTGNTTTTEFNTGAQQEHAHTAADGVTGGGRGSGHQLRGTVTGGDGTWYAGLSLAGATGHDVQDTRTTRAGSGNTTKVKVAANVFSGEAVLHFEVEWRDRGTKHTYFRRPLGLEVVVDQHETRETPPPRPDGAGPVPTGFDSDNAPRGAALRGLVGPRPDGVTVQRPPERVWTHGLLDTDVVRSVGITQGAQQSLLSGGREFLGAGTWEKIQGTVRRMVDPVALANSLTNPITPGQRPDPDGGEGARTVVSGPGTATLLVGPEGPAGDTRVEVRVRITELEFQRNDRSADASPSNAAPVGSSSHAQRSLQGAARVTIGAQWDVTGGQIVGGRAGGYGDVAYQRRNGITTGEGGQVLNNAKIRTATVQYRGMAEVEVIYRKDGEELVRKEFVPVEIGIPDRDTADAAVPANGTLRFHEGATAGELRLPGAPPRAVELVARALQLDARQEESHERLLRVGGAARRLFPDTLAADTPQARQWLRGLDRLLTLAGEPSTAGGPPLADLRALADGADVPAPPTRRLQDLARHFGGDDRPTPTADEVTAHWNQQQEPLGEPELHPPIEPRPTVRRTVAQLDGAGLETLLREVADLPPGPDAETPRLIVITLDAPGGAVTPEAVRRLHRRTDELEERLRGLRGRLPHPVDVEIRVAAGDPGAGAAAPGDWDRRGGVRHFRVTPDLETSIFHQLVPDHGGGRP
ncbi:hypothetical protein ACFVGM_06405 [Kitasatospora purpeofusca]|uniref:hypothetical protein n=1 Tax=Kitasatospora purpeofusca TaxID=67352 RepID=UPI0036CD2C7F